MNKEKRASLLRLDRRAVPLEQQAAAPRVERRRNRGAKRTEVIAKTISTAAAARTMSISVGTVLKLIKGRAINARRNRGAWPHAGYAVDFQSVLDLIERKRKEKR